MKKLHPLMFVGTGSDVGKSILAAAFCRIFRQDGYAPAPFKAQNMALNSYATPDGFEIGRAQAVQAEAAGIPCETDMFRYFLNPVLTIRRKWCCMASHWATSMPTTTGGGAVPISITDRKYAEPSIAWRLAIIPS